MKQGLAVQFWYDFESYQAKETPRKGTLHGFFQHSEAAGSQFILGHPYGVIETVDGNIVHIKTYLIKILRP